jgi:hypothetical protein
MTISNLKVLSISLLASAVILASVCLALVTASPWCLLSGAFVLAWAGVMGAIIDAPA